MSPLKPETTQVAGLTKIFRSISSRGLKDVKQHEFIDSPGEAIISPLRHQGSKKQHAEIRVGYACHSSHVWRGLLAHLQYGTRVHDALRMPRPLK
jgi:hypothetical protein